ncbi:hypothetical protein RvY_13260-2 [Ramazzottius varieornatus]|uniref:FAD-binding PCMH-type domain-containing protein n=1 Tax=Ramazzottius varieornatus TaxID=947166 RepID=A0A1D1VM92_RAMVA|nr:hypothetical protein RvY_13260-2 [Ramazzottius varieornatus]
MTPPVSADVLPAEEKITVTINGVKYNVPTTFSEVSLATYVRRHLHLTGTKLMCREGGCGICTVHVAHPDASGQIVQRSINSCLCPILSCDGWEVTTVEGIGSQEKPHPVQQALTDHYGTQCGFCTPGWIMTMYSLLQNSSGRSLTKQQIENNMDGNYCRCTGYRPILDAFKTFAQDGVNANAAVCDLEDVGSKTCKTTGGPCHGKCADFRAGSPYVAALAMEAAMIAPPWYKPTTLDELYKKAEELAGKNVYYVVGHTGKGVYNDYPYDAYVDLKGIAALSGVTKTDKVLTIAANTPLTDVISTFNQTASTSGFKYLTTLAAIISKTAHTSVRNAGSWAGNLALKNQHHDFPSDTYTAFTMAGTQLMIGPENKLYSMEDFLTFDLKGKFILQAHFPTYSDDYVFRTYKIMPRATNAHALVEAGFRAKLDKGQQGQVVITERPALIFANINDEFVHAKATEDFLTGKNIADPQLLKGALTTLQNEVQPKEDPAEASVEYRRSLAVSLFYKFALELVGDLADARYKTAVGSLVRPVSSGSQSFETKQENWPITQAIPKLESMVQCTGEAKYISDIETEGILRAAFVLTTQANASIYRLDATAAMALPGVLRVITASDVPGKNVIGTPGRTPIMGEEILATTQSYYAGQPVAIVVAVSREMAEEGAKLVKVEYFNVQTPILTCLDAINSNSFHETKMKDINVGDAEVAVKNAAVSVEGSFEMGAQQHFHTETMVTVCYPTEDGMNVEAGTQFIDGTQSAIAQACGLGKNKINVTVKRNGGGFGAKGSRINIVAAAVGIAAFVMKRPVKMHQSLWDNFKLIGRRLPYLIKYKAGTDAAGKLAGIVLDVYGDCGYQPSASVIVNGLPNWIDNIYFSPAWKVRLHACKTNTPPNTHCRAPGSTEGIYMTEYVLQHLAYASGKNPVDLKRQNFLKNGDNLLEGATIKDCNIGPLTEQLMSSASYNDRAVAVDQFNKDNRWRKRGISVVPMRFAVHWRNGNYNCLVAIFHEGGTIAVTHGGIELGQGINTKVVQVIAYELGVEMSRIQVQPTMAITNANARGTYGSISTELVCLSAIECCRQLNDRLKPVKDANPNVKWEDLIETCYKQGIDLSARTWTNPKPEEPLVYNTYCAMCTEVEVDILTGESHVLRLDCLYDCGESISPYIGKA